MRPAATARSLLTSIRPAQTVFWSKQRKFELRHAQRLYELRGDPDNVLRAHDLHELRPSESRPGEVEGARQWILDHRADKPSDVASVDDLQMIGAIAWRQHFAVLLRGAATSMNTGHRDRTAPRRFVAAEAYIGSRRSPGQGFDDMAADKLRSAQDQYLRAGQLPFSSKCRRAAGNARFTGVWGKYPGQDSNLRPTD